MNRKNTFLQTFDKLACCHNPLDIRNDFVLMFACDISNKADATNFRIRKERRKKIIEKYNEFELILFKDLIIQTIISMEENPYQDFLGDIFVELKLQDPYASPMLRATALESQNRTILLVRDNDEITALMRYIQLSILQCAAYVKVGESLDGTLENCWYTPAYFLDVTHTCKNTFPVKVLGLI